MISNVPGPPFPLYLAGAELVAAYPMGPIMDGAGLNITVLSYRDHIDIGFMADRELVPDVWDMADSVQPAFEELAAAGRARRTRPGPQDGGAGDRHIEGRQDARQPARRRQPPKKAPAREGRQDAPRQRSRQEGSRQEAARRHRRADDTATVAAANGSAGQANVTGELQRVLVCSPWPTTSQTSSNTPSTRFPIGSALIYGADRAGPSPSSTTGQPDRPLAGRPGSGARRPRRHLRA